MHLIKQTLLFIAVIYSSMAIANEIPRSKSPTGASVYIVSPTNGSTVSSTFTVIFGLKGMGVAPAGTEKEATGHHHLLVDGKMMPPLDQPLGKEIKHFGAGQTETELTLSPGPHTLQLILGDKGHIPHDPPVVSQIVTINVQ
jgi:hypothetical protein